ncbi:hypothetical protein M569_01840 [Genlisea aurea]|uniref:Peptidase A1 domain-containing protein n=1 Tax=Genlisea aurea TaxID=192259 RepID=S8CZK8_9LAMI|nr:hypothetical protein M569_01840 [Genlisea aurea]
MAVQILLLSFFLLYTSSSITASDPCSSPSHSDLSIVHIHGPCSPFRRPRAASPMPWLDETKDLERVSYLANRPISAPVASGQAVGIIGNYVVRIKIGSPGQTMYTVLDTSSDVGWVPCTGCTGCGTAQFDTSSSTSYEPLDCTLPQCTFANGASCPTTGSSCLFNQSYGGDTLSAALARDVLVLGNGQVANYAFGCVTAVVSGGGGGSVPPQGLLGLGRGYMSMISQAGALAGVFSYCLPSFRSYYFSGSLKLGLTGQPTNIRTTPLLRNPHRPSLYYVNLTGISVGRVNVPIDPQFLAFDPNTGAGTIIDSGTVITRFVGPIYEAVRDEFKKQLTGPFTSLGAFDTCFTATNQAEAPTVTLHFTGLDLKLPVENTLIHSSSGSLGCLAMASAPDNVNSVLNIIASLQQQNLRIVFDTVNSHLGITREVCN